MNILDLFFFYPRVFGDTGSFQDVLQLEPDPPLLLDPRSPPSGGKVGVLHGVEAVDGREWRGVAQREAGAVHHMTQRVSVSVALKPCKNQI